MLIDSHAHLEGKEFDDDRNAVIERAQKAGLKRILSCGTTLASSEANVQLAEEQLMIYAAIGIHPHESQQTDETTIARFKQLATNKRVVAIGETGLDYYYNLSPHDIQQQSLRLHIRLAKEVQLPLSIHCRDSEEDLLKILQEENAREVGGVIHCFTGTRKTAEACLELGFYLGVSGIVTFKTAKELAELFSKVPLERLLVETDSPYLAPIPHRGKRNEPAFVVNTAQKLAELKSLSSQEVEETTTRNAEQLFWSARTPR